MRFVIAWLFLLVACAIGTVCFFASSWLEQREINAAIQAQEVLGQQLPPIAANIHEVILNFEVAIERELQSHNVSRVEDNLEMRRHPLVAHLLVLDSADRLVPGSSGGKGLSDDDRLILSEAMQLLHETFPTTPAKRLKQSIDSQNVDLNRLAQTPDQVFGSDLGGSSPQEIAESAEVPGTTNLKWLTWYHGRGLMLAYISSQSSDIYGQLRILVVLPRSRWMSDVVNALPDSSTSPNFLLDSNADQLRGVPSATSNEPGILTRLVDAENNSIYQWTNGTKASTDLLDLNNHRQATFDLASPLSGWQLQLFASPRHIENLKRLGISAWPIWTLVGLLAACLIGLGSFVAMNVNRQLRLAKSRVSFVNQVSHELRTPLTNICLYTDLLHSELEGSSVEEEPLFGQRIEIIRSEIHRLGHVIDNVMRFARADRGATLLRKSKAVPNVIIENVVSSFMPALQELDFDVQLDLSTEQQRLIDSSALQQILVNLVSNCEKYAASGRYLKIKSYGTQTTLVIEVEDRGKGIPARFRKRIFNAFYRIRDGVSDPAGMGIGLAIVRTLAQAHGGDCQLKENSSGSCFVVTIQAPMEADIQSDS
ncbi:MAG: HAMP domain-containing histidine kinase [Planctomycetales bacterium]|nr:HAMP domain-containing histidine kinase [Planctomycetales bacterium]